MKKYFSTKKLCFVALFTAMNAALSSFGIPLLNGHLYLCDIVICFAALIFDPFSAFIIGGVGSFLGDFIFYPVAMFVSLITRGIQAAVISLIAGRKESVPKFWQAIIAVTVGAVIMNVGYFLGGAYVYATIEYAFSKIPCEVLQAVFGAVVAIVLLFFTRIKSLVAEIPKR